MTTRLLAVGGAMVLVTGMALLDGAAHGSTPGHHAQRPGTTLLGTLAGVDAVNPDDVWAVGINESDPARWKTRALHWDGQQWSPTPTVSPGAIKSELNGVAAVATDDVWAVGDDADEIGGDAMHTLVEHWDGTAWARVQSPTPKGRNQTLTGISAVAADDIWAVGRYSALDLSQRTLILHYDGRRWHRVASPNVGDTSTLSSVTTISSEDAWAAGSYFDAKARSYPPLLLHWDGSDWTRVKEAAPGGQRSTGLTGISADTATDIWASGWRPRGHGFVEHGDGQSWSFADAPAGPALFGVSALTATDVWTVGKAYQGGRAVAEHWDGVTWTVDDRLFAGDAYLSAVDALAAGDVWAVGAYADGSRSRTLLMHFDGQGWTHP